MVITTQERRSEGQINWTEPKPNTASARNEAQNHVRKHNVSAYKSNELKAT